MKYQPARHIFGQTLPTLLVAALLAAGCESRNDATGLSVIPDYTKVTTETATLPLSYSTISAGSLGGRLTGETTPDGMTLNNIFVNSGYAYIGSIPNEEYGEVKSEYLTQFYVPKGFKFTKEVYKDKIDSVFLTLYYSGYTGDGAQPMEVEAYKLKKTPPMGDKYSLGDISAYTDGAELIGQVSYTAASGNGKTETSTTIRIPISKTFGQEIYDRSRKGDPVFASQEAFNAYFPGVYLKNGAGKGSILRVARTALTFYYQTKNAAYDPAKPKEGVKEYITGVQELSHTGEVPQASRYGNYDLDKLTSASASESGYSYIKAPAGVFTEVTIPTTRLAGLLKPEPGIVKALNSAPLTVVGEPNEANAYLLNAPSYLLLLPRDSVQHFFESEFTELNTRLTAYVSTTTIAGSATYTFGNIAPLLSEHVKAKPSEDLHVVLIPVERTIPSERSGNSGSAQKISTSISNQILPAAVKFRKDGDINKALSIVITRRKDGAAF